ncbi:MAG TPA: hypothetical protein VNB24_08170 [Acidimicrobiales bacterium]|nr:hypothetical protein [Acidimicrobiales bacterium]
MLAAIIVVYLLRGLFWVGTTQVLSPIDELQHADYIASISEGDGIPVVGKSVVREELLSYAKFRHSSFVRYAPHTADVDDVRWGPTVESYEGFQGPTYYVLMAPAWVIGREVGDVRGAVLATRAASIMLASLGLLVAWLLARRLFPGRPEVWLAAPAVLAVVTGASANVAAISNEALVIPLAGATLLPLATALADRTGGLTRRRAIATGLLVGLAVVTKTTCMALAPLIVVGVIGIAWLQRSGWRAAATFVAWTGAVGGAVLAPLVAWNLHAYGATSANEAVDAITGPLQPFYTANLDGVLQILRWGFFGYWELSLTSTLDHPVALTMFGITALVAVVAIARRWFEGDRRDAFALAWLALAFPFVFAFMLVVIFVVFDGHSGTIGRHMYPSLVPSAVLLAGATVLGLGRRAGFVALAGIAVFMTWNEVRSVDRYIQLTYETFRNEADLVPGRDLRAGDGLVQGGTFVVRPNCSAEAVGLVAASNPPQFVTAHIGSAAPRQLKIVNDYQIGVVRSVSVYKLPRPTREPIRVTVDPSVDLSASGGTPIGEAWCRFRDPGAARFAQTFTPDHPRILTRAVVLGWPKLWFGAAVAALIASLVHAVRRREPAHD